MDRDEDIAQAVVSELGFCLGGPIEARIANLIADTRKDEREACARSERSRWTAERSRWTAERDRLVGSLLDLWLSCHREAGFALAESDHHELATALNRLYAHCDIGK